MSTEQFLYFPPFCLDLMKEQLFRDDKPQAIRAQNFAVLRYLAERAGQVVPKDNLMRAIWGSYPAEESLKQCIFQLRELLGDNSGTRRFIETVRGQGYRFIAPIKRAPFRRAPHMTKQPRLVGREKELETLTRLLAEARHGERQIVFITGEPGIGKTALVDAFLSQLSDDSASVIGRGQCIEHYGEGEAYLPMLEALGQVSRWVDREPFVDFLSQYAPTWLVQLPSLATKVDREALQRNVQGSTRQRMLREFVEAVEIFTVGNSNQDLLLLILVLEDLHWSDYSTLELLSALARRRESARLLILATYRPAEGLVEGHPLRSVIQELRGHNLCQALVLPLLDEDAVWQYLQQRFPSAMFPARFPLVLYQLTGGNPLFLVAVIDDLIAQRILEEVGERWVLQGNVDAVAAIVPENIRQLIGRQVERVSPKGRRILEAASIAGQEFSTAAISAATDLSQAEVEEFCNVLAHQGLFLQAAGVIEWPDRTLSARYKFRHALHQQLWHERVGVKQRQQLHLRIGECQEVAYGDRVGEIAAELALHFEQGRNYQRAVYYLQRAAENAAQLNAPQEEIVHLTKALELLGKLPDGSERNRQELDLQTTLGPALVAVKGYGALEVAKTYSRAQELCHQGAEPSRLFSALFGLWAFYGARADYKMVYEIGEQLLSLAQRQQEPSLLLVGHWAVGCSLFYHLADFASAREHLEKGIALYDPQQQRSLIFQYGYDPGVSCHCFAALSLFSLGYPDQALQRSQGAIVHAQARFYPFGEAYALTFAAWLHLYRRDGLVAQTHIETAIALAHQQEFPYWTAMGMIFHGRALAKQGQLDEGITQMRQGLDAWRKMEAKTNLPYYLALLADTYGKKGWAKEGLTLIVEALEEADGLGEHFYEAELYRLKGELLLIAECGARNGERNTRKKGRASSDHCAAQAEAEACFHKAIEVARRQKAKMWELRAVISLSQLWQREGKKKAARQMLEELYNWFTEGLETKDLQEAKELLVQLQ